MQAECQNARTRTFALTQGGSIPSPKDIGLTIPIILSTGLLVRFAAFISATPRVNGRDALALAIVRKAASLAEIITDTVIPLLNLALLQWGAKSIRPPLSYRLLFCWRKTTKRVHINNQNGP
jgi:hypothetical protein